MKKNMYTKIFLFFLLNGSACYSMQLSEVDKKLFNHFYLPGGSLRANIESREKEIICCLDQGANPDLIASGQNYKHTQNHTILLNLALGHIDQSRTEIAKLLLMAGANPNFKCNCKSDAAGITPLHALIDSVASENFMKILLEYGADPRIECNGCSVFHEILSRHNLSLRISLNYIKAVLANATYGPWQSKQACQASKKRMVTYLCAVKQLNNIPKDLQLKILTFMPEDWYNSKMTARLLPLVSKEQYLTIFRECPFLLIKEAVASNKYTEQKQPWLKQLILENKSYRIHEAQKMLNSTNETTKTVYQVLNEQMVDHLNKCEHRKTTSMIKMSKSSEFDDTIAHLIEEQIRKDFFRNENEDNK